MADERLVKVSAEAVLNNCVQTLADGRKTSDELQTQRCAIYILQPQIK